MFCQVEAQLNSRPLCPASMEATDYSALTPGHFLLGKAPMSLPEVDIPEPTPTNRLTRWNRIQKMQQSFWKQWSQDYLATLQQRNKWTTPQPNLQVHDLVLLKKENMAPTQWPLARILEVHPNPADHFVRVVTLKTKDSVLKRPINKLIRLPIEH